MRDPRLDEPGERGEHPHGERERKPYRPRNQTRRRLFFWAEIQKSLIVFVDHCGAAIQADHATVEGDDDQSKRSVELDSNENRRDDDRKDRLQESLWPISDFAEGEGLHLHSLFPRKHRKRRNGSGQGILGRGVRQLLRSWMQHRISSHKRL